MSVSYLSLLNGTWNLSGLNELQELQLADAGSVAEAECLLHSWFNSTRVDTTSEVFCNTSWDYLYCWPQTPAGTVITTRCSDIFHQANSQFSIHLEGQVKRTCFRNGTWSQGGKSNYKECADSLKSHIRNLNEDDTLLLVMQYMLFLGSIFSLIFLGISLTIFYCYFRCVRCNRVTVQAHLMVALVLRFIMMFVISEPLVFDHASSYRDVDILCETIVVGFLYSTFSSVSWMFIQGLYLNITLMVGVGNSIARYELLIYYIIGWAVPAVFVLDYVIAMLLRKQERCWNGYSEMDEMWILLCPIISFWNFLYSPRHEYLQVNGIFLLNILRILLRKIRNSHSRPDSSQLKATAKATAVLFPVLGVNNLLLLYNPGGEYNNYFVALNTFFGSTQGIFVALVYCFINKEVWNAVRRSVQRLNASRNLHGASASECQSRMRVSPQTMVEYSRPSMDARCAEHEL